MSHETAEYLVLQYVRDPLRQEGRNVGVVVRKGETFAARFFGEEGAALDGRKIRSFASPEAYRDWVAFWRRSLGEPDPFAAILSVQRENYHARLGGAVRDTGNDPASQVADYLYSVMVSEGGYAEVLAAAEAEGGRVAPTAPKLEKELVDAFRQANILASDQADELPLVRYPIRHRAPVSGKVGVPHRPEFSQVNGKLVVIETVDFTVSKKEHARDHAGLTAFMFADLREKDGGQVETIAVVKQTVEVVGEDAVSYGLSLLDKTANQVVDWHTHGQQFVEERRLFALGEAKR